MTWETVIAQPCELGESPFWHPEEQMLYWLDIPVSSVRIIQGRKAANNYAGFDPLMSVHDLNF